MTDQEEKPTQLPSVREPVNVDIVNGSFAPKNIDQLWRLAVIVSKSGMCPAEFKDNPEKTFVAMSYGMELGLSPMTCLASIYVINNRPTIFGDMPLALCMRDGIEGMAETFEGKPYEDTFKAVCTVKSTKNNYTVIREFSVADAKTAGLWGKKTSGGGSTPWITHPKRMLQFKARTFALRDACPGALRGVPIYEEIESFVESDQVGPQTVSVQQTVTPSDPSAFSSEGPKDPVIPAETVDPSDIERVFRDIVEANLYTMKDAEELLVSIMDKQGASREDTLRTIADEPARFIKYANAVFAKKALNTPPAPLGSGTATKPPQAADTSPDVPPGVSPEGLVRLALIEIISKDIDLAGMGIDEIYSKYLAWAMHNSRMTNAPVKEIIADWATRTATTIPFFKKWLFNPMVGGMIPEPVDNTLKPSEASWKDRLAGLKVKYPEEFESVRQANGFAISVPTEEGAKHFVLKIHEHLDNPKTKTKTKTKKGAKS